MKRLLWLCTHRTQWREEVPLLLDAGFEVVPVHKSHELYPIDEQPNDPYYVQDWRKRCTLPAKIVDRIRAVNWFHEAPGEVLPLARKVFDGVIITSFLDTVLLFSRWFTKPIFYRVFGRGVDPCYTERYGMPMVQELGETRAYRQDLYHWCPILPTLSQPENAILTKNEILLEPFVSLDRLPVRWHEDKSEPSVVMVLSRMACLKHVANIFQQIAGFGAISDRLPLRVLGQNEPGGPFNDPRILGTLPDAEYFQTLARSRVFFYEGESILHLHWSVWEALGMGIPVVMLQSSYPAWALCRIVGLSACGPEFGVARDFEEAREMLFACLKEPAVALAIAERQQPLVNYITDRDRAVCQYQDRLQAILGPTNRNDGAIQRWARKILSFRQETILAKTPQEKP